MFSSVTSSHRLVYLADGTSTVTMWHHFAYRDFWTLDEKWRVWESSAKVTRSCCIVASSPLFPASLTLSCFPTALLLPQSLPSFNLVSEMGTRRGSSQRTKPDLDIGDGLFKGSYIFLRGCEKRKSLIRMDIPAVTKSLRPRKSLPPRGQNDSVDFPYASISVSKCGSRPSMQANSRRSSQVVKASETARIWIWQVHIMLLESFATGNLLLNWRQRNDLRFGNLSVTLMEYIQILVVLAEYSVDNFDQRTAYSISIWSTFVEATANRTMQISHHPGIRGVGSALFDRNDTPISAIILPGHLTIPDDYYQRTPRLLRQWWWGWSRRLESCCDVNSIAAWRNTRHSFDRQASAYSSGRTAKSYPIKRQGTLVRPIIRAACDWRKYFFRDGETQNTRGAASEIESKASIHGGDRRYWTCCNPTGRKCSSKWSSQSRVIHLRYTTRSRKTDRPTEKTTAIKRIGYIKVNDIYDKYKNN